MILGKGWIATCNSDLEIATMMRWTAPERHRCARMRLLSSLAKEAVRGRYYNNWAGPCEARFPGTLH
jgi:hypothetical protein